MKILLVDDSVVIRDISTAILAQLGHTDVETASDGREALAKLGQVSPDLIVVDWNMPGMDGLTFVRELRKFDKRTPVIMATTEFERRRVIDAVRAGVDDYVVKPYRPELLAERIAAALAKRGSAA